MMVKLSTVRAAIDLEPEHNGDMPDEMWDAIKNDRAEAQHAFTLCVRYTKAGIKRRLADFINEGK